MKRLIGYALVIFLMSLSLPTIVAAAGEKILVFCYDGLKSSMHAKSIAAGLGMLRQYGQANGFSIDSTADTAKLTSANLTKYDALAFLDADDTSRASKPSEEDAIKGFIESGRGFIGIHCVERNFLSWSWYHQMIGSSYIYDYDTAKMIFHVTDTANPLTKGIPSTFSVSYQQRRNDTMFFNDTSKSFKVLVTSDSTNYSSAHNKNYSYPDQKMSTYFPWVWTHEYDGGHIWCGFMGHTPETFTSDTILSKLILNGILYALNRNGQFKPEAPALSSPANGSAGLATSCTFAWASVASATSYTFQVATSSTFGTTVASQTNLTAAVVDAGKLSAGLPYYWRVDAMNPAGESVWSSMWKFSVGTVSTLPNKTSKMVTSFQIKNARIAYSMAAEEPVEITISNLDGRQLRSFSCVYKAGSHVFNIAGWNLSPGVYLVRFKAGDFEKLIPVRLVG